MAATCLPSIVTDVQYGTVMKFVSVGLTCRRAAFSPCRLCGWSTPWRLESRLLLRARQVDTVPRRTTVTAMHLARIRQNAQVLKQLEM